MNPSAVASTVRLHLLATAGVSALVGTRIYRLVLPQNPRLPALTLQRISRVTNDTMSGDTGPDDFRIQVDSWAADPAAAEQLAAAVEAVLRNWGSGDILRARFDGDRDFFEAGASPAELYRVSADYIVTAAVAAA